MTTKIFLNAAGFLRIRQDPDYKEPKNRSSGTANYTNSPDPLDDTRVHPEDYELARKMATDALELDEEDIHGEHPSNVVSTLMKDDDKIKKLEELNLDEFAVSMHETNGDLKRYTLNIIRAELLKPFGELRRSFTLPEPWHVLTSLTTQGERSLIVGLIINVTVIRVFKTYVVVKLDSGIEGIINGQYLSDEAVSPESVVTKGSVVRGVIIDVKIDLAKDLFSVELSSRQSDVQAGDEQFLRIKHDEHWNHVQSDRDDDVLARQRRAANKGVTRRIVKHPNFRNFNSAEAETFLENQPQGEVLIRPSSKGVEHLAVTWKVADKLYQHIGKILIFLSQYLY